MSDDTPRIPGLPAASDQGDRPVKAHMVVDIHANAEHQKEGEQRKGNADWPHAAPNSVYICAMGNHWRQTDEESPWAYVMDMVKYSHKMGIVTQRLEEIQDRCLLPYDALGTMRNEGWMKALQGFEYVLYIDNDVRPPKEMLYQMIKARHLVSMPYIEEPPKEDPSIPIRILHGPTFPRHSGTHRVKWAVLSFMLFNVNVLRPWNGGFWENAVGADEGYHFQKLYAGTGIQPYVNTDIECPVGAAPTYPLTQEKDDPDWRKRKREELDEADQRGPHPQKLQVVTQEGAYMPIFDGTSQPEAPPICAVPHNQLDLTCALPVGHIDNDGTPTPHQCGTMPDLNAWPNVSKIPVTLYDPDLAKGSPAQPEDAAAFRNGTNPDRCGDRNPDDRRYKCLGEEGHQGEHEFNVPTPA